MKNQITAPFRISMDGRGEVINANGDRVSGYQRRWLCDAGNACAGMTDPAQAIRDMREQGAVLAETHRAAVALAAKNEELKEIITDTTAAAKGFQQEITRLRARIVELEREADERAFELTPAMVVARNYQLAEENERLLAACVAAERFLNPFITHIEPGEGSGDVLTQLRAALAAKGAQ